ncbi:DUF317 domain-containing protein [Streptomyces shenzhenensis]|uniref:DUF317 domain-containing protein n=1 Tax=Streptomyces shenzhenensis TaxID=943815 RepID=UPI0033CB1B2B
MTDSEHPNADPEPDTRVDTFPAYDADPGDHRAILDEFATEQGWDKHTWPHDTTHVIHASQTLRIQFLNDADPREDAWTIAAYDTPVSDRTWHLTLTADTPTPILKRLLTILAEEDWGPADFITDKTIAQATRPLLDAAWQPTPPGRWLHWKPLHRTVHLSLDAFAARDPDSTLIAWTISAGTYINRPDWAINASTHTPADLLTRLAEELAHGTGTRRTARRSAQRITQTAAALPPEPSRGPSAPPRR